MSGVRIKRGGAGLVFGAFGGLCALVVIAYSASGDPSDFGAFLPLVPLGMISASIVAALLVPVFVYSSIFQAMGVGALSALLSQIVFAFGMIFLGIASDPATMSFGELVDDILFLILGAWIIAGIPQVILGGIAGASCYRWLSVEAHTDE